jgi:hypothetical protein
MSVVVTPEGGSGAEQVADVAEAAVEAVQEVAEAALEAVAAVADAMAEAGPEPAPVVVPEPREHSHAEIAACAASIEAHEARIAALEVLVTEVVENEPEPEVEATVVTPDVEPVEDEPERRTGVMGWLQSLLR